jgi:hypothetical protein
LRMVPRLRFFRAESEPQDQQDDREQEEDDPGDRDERPGARWATKTPRAGSSPSAPSSPGSPSDRTSRCSTPTPPWSLPPAASATQSSPGRSTTRSDTGTVFASAPLDPPLHEALLHPTAQESAFTGDTGPHVPRRAPPREARRPRWCSLTVPSSPRMTGDCGGRTPANRRVADPSIADAGSASDQATEMLICRNFKPSSGLEPETPPYMQRWPQLVAIVGNGSQVAKPFSRPRLLPSVAAGCVRSAPQVLHALLP